jgi:hypothetical protein
MDLAARYSYDKPQADWPNSYKIVHPYLQALGSIPGTAWKVYRLQHNQDSKRVFNLQTRIVANVLHGHMIDIAQRLCVNEPGLHFVESWQGMTVVIVEKQVAVRMKKFSRSLMTSNLQTKIQKEIQSGEQMDAFGPQVRHMVTVGYIPNETWTNHNGIFITDRIKDHLLWHVQLDDGLNVVHDALIRDLFHDSDVGSETGDGLKMKIKDNAKRPRKPYNEDGDSQPRDGSDSA